jgi:hypothetical protein
MKSKGLKSTSYLVQDVKRSK